jgi:multimeric flavodoxin WrbA
MNIALINGSPKSKDSASGHVLKALKAFLEPDRNGFTEYSFRKSQVSEEEMKQLGQSDVLVFAFPLYVDGIPSHLLSCLVQLESFFTELCKKDILVYALVNCGFYEGHQNNIAIEMMKNWCAKAGLKWGQGVGIGSGGMLPMLNNIPIGKGPTRNLEAALKQVSGNVIQGMSSEDISITANFPRLLYKLAAEMGWRKAVKENGLKRRDLFMRR